MNPRIRTAAGIEIGGAYLPPPPAVSDDAERLQAALLRKPRRHHVVAFRGAMKPRRLPALTPTTRVGRLIAWIRSFL